MSLPSVTVIVPTFQRANALTRTLAAISDVDYPSRRLEIVVVDDGSTDSTAHVVGSFPAVRYIWQPNSGVSVARNRGAQVANGDILLFVDDDIVVLADNVRRHHATRQRYAECIVAGHSELDPELLVAWQRSSLGRFRLQLYESTYQVPSSRTASPALGALGTVAAANMSITQTLFWALGGFDERFPVGGEDQDLCWRARATGCALVHDHEIRVLHNDQHGNLQALCDRQERGAVGVVCLWRKHADFPRPAMVGLNGPVQAGDSRAVIVRKIIRAALSRRLILTVLHGFVQALQVIWPDGDTALHFFFRGITGLYVFRGVRRGLRFTTGPDWAPTLDVGR